MTFFTYLHLAAPVLAGLAWLAGAAIITNIFPDDDRRPPPPDSAFHKRVR